MAYCHHIKQLDQSERLCRERKSEAVSAEGEAILDVPAPVDSTWNRTTAQLSLTNLRIIRIIHCFKTSNLEMVCYTAINSNTTT